MAWYSNASLCGCTFSELTFNLLLHPPETYQSLAQVQNFDHSRILLILSLIHDGKDMVSIRVTSQNYWVVCGSPSPSPNPSHPSPSPNRPSPSPSQIFRIIYGISSSNSGPTRDNLPGGSVFGDLARDRMASRITVWIS